MYMCILPTFLKICDRHMSNLRSVTNSCHSSKVLDPVGRIHMYMYTVQNGL